LIETIKKLKFGKGKVDIPEYDFKTHTRRKDKINQTIFGADVIILEV
jgi:uridine kinase